MQAGYVQEKSLGYVQNSVGAIDTAITIASLFPSGVIPAGTQLLLISAQAAIRWRDDGVAPTTAIGYPLAANAELRFTGQTGRLQVIGQAASAVINVIAYGTGAP